MTRVANYCPECGTALEPHEHNGAIRPVCPACGHVVYFDPKVAVVVFIRQAGKALFIQRAMNPGQGKWALPAGFVDAGEDPQAAAVREVQEETGYRTEVIRLLDVFPKRDNGLADIIIAYEAQITGGHLQADDDAADARWFSKNDVPELVFYPSITLTKRWQDDTL